MVSARARCGPAVCAAHGAIVKSEVPTMPRIARARRVPALLALAAVAAAGTVPVTPALADDAPTAAAAPRERPARGMPKTQVEAKYGAPASRTEAVGQPPISRWDYPGMIVFFEHDHVVHAVLTGAG
jgi:hypothetical protein